MQKNDGGKNLLAVVGFYIMQPIAQMVVLFLLGAWHGLKTGSGDGKSLEAFINSQTVVLLLAANLLCLGGVILLAGRQKQPLLEYCGMAGRLRMPSGLLLCVLLGLSSNLWASMVLSLLPIPADTMASYAQSVALLSTGPLWLEVLSIVLVVPVVEEILFRGLIFKSLRAIMPAGLAILGQGLLFGFLHGDPIWIAYAAIFGCVLGYVRYLTGTVRASILVHIAFNGSSYIFSMFAEEYLNSNGLLLIFFIGSALLLIGAVAGIYRQREELNGR